MKLGSVVLRVRDLDQSRRWYETQLGLRVREVNADSRLALLDVGSIVPLCLWQDDEGAAPQRPPAAFPVFVVDDARATRESLEANGVGCDVLREDAICRRFSVNDPDGNRLEIVETKRAAARGTADGPQVASDLTVAFSADQPGTLARALEALTRAGLDTGGYAEIEGFFHLLVSNPDAARRAFEQAGFRVEGDQPVLVVDVERHPGSTAGLFRQVADAGVNVSFTYASADGRLVIGTRDVDRLMDALGEPGNEDA